MSKRVLLTGHGGFVGSHCLEYFLANTDWEIIGIDSFRHKGTCRRVVEATQNNPRVKTYQHDLTVPFDGPLENLIFERKIDKNGVVTEKPIDLIINLASESAVERSTVDPTGCIRNNVNLMLNMLEFARKCKGLKSFLHLSTDEVFGEAGPGPGHHEWDRIMPGNPYAASKASQESFAISYWRTYNLPIMIISCMNMIGERQDPEKFLPKLIQKICQGQEMPIYGDSLESIGSRVYLHSKNLADALVFLSDYQPVVYSDYVATGNTWEAHPGKFNVCGETEINNLELAQTVAGILGKELKYKLIPSESARPGYDRRYALDGSLMKSMGWEAPISFEQSIENIVKWTLDNPHWLM